MRQILRCLVAAIFSIGGPVCAQNVSADSADDYNFRIEYQYARRYLTGLMDREIIIKGLGRDTVYRLPNNMIIIESETIELENIRLSRGIDYSINYRFGEIRFTTTVAEGVQIKVRYKILPFGIRNEYSLRDSGSIRLITDTAGLMKKIEIFQQRDMDNALFRQNSLSGSGSITRGFTIGSNQDFTLNSGLNIQISGQLSDDVTVEASLTDESTPIQPEGNTETLQEIDKVFVEIKKADRYSATFGDFDFILQGTEFGQYSRKLQGIKAAVNTDKIKADFAFASSEGRYTSNIITPSEGVQGPYELSGANGEKNIIIIAGTEKVWLNGVLMRRGEDQDYIIDYSAGQIWFTRRRLIAPESRVVVDFEYTEDLYRRNSLAARIHAHLYDGKIKTGGIFIHEYDDKSNPVNISLSSDLIDSLSGINDKTLTGAGNVIFISGAVPTIFGRGAYIKVFDPIHMDSIFVYQGNDSAGNYNVRFTNVGAGQGDYVRGLILGEFRFAGKNQGDYLPVIPLTLPTKNILSAMFIEAKPAKAWTLYSEFALTGFDINSYSPGQITGKAFLVNVRAERQKIILGKSSLGEFDLNLRIRQKDSTFTEISRLNQADFNRDWNVRQASSQNPGSASKEIIQEFSGEYRPRPFMRFAPYYGHLGRGEKEFISDRYGALLHISKDKLPFIQYRLDKINSKTPVNDQTEQSSVDRHSLISRYRFWKLEPGFDLETEDISSSYSGRDSIYGTAYRLYRPKLDVLGYSRTQFGLSYERRYDKIRNNRNDSLDGTVSVATTSRFYWTLSGWKNISSAVEFTQRKKEFIGKFRTADNTDKLTRLINSTVDYTPLNRAVQVSMNYQVSEEQIQNRKIIFIPVGPNQGNYIQVAQDSFRQVPQGQGDWIQGSVRSNRFTPVVELSAGLRVRVDLYRIMNEHGNQQIITADTLGKKKKENDFWTWFMNNTAYETFLRIEENQQNPDWSFYFINWNVYQRKTATIRGSLLMRQDLIIFPQLSNRTIRCRYEHQQNLTNLLIDGRDQRKRISRLIRWREQLTTAWSMEHEFDYETNRRRSQINYGGIQPDFTIRRIKALPSISVRPKNHIEFIVRGQWITAQEKIQNITTRLISIQPEINYSFQMKGRITANAEIVKVSINKPGMQVLYEMADGNQKGTTYRWMIHSDYRIGEHLSASLNYTGRKDPAQDIIHIASAELRAFF